jgi:hypothetical protein
LTVLDNHRRRSTISRPIDAMLPLSSTVLAGEGTDVRPGVMMLTVAIGLAGAGVAEAQKGKPAPQPTVVNWRCDVDMRDEGGDAIRSDGNPRYVDGEGGFVCAVSPQESAQLGNPAPESGNFYLGRRPARSFLLPARPGAWAAAIDKGLQVRVFDIVDIPVGTTETRAMAIPTSAIGAMYADDLGGADTVTDLVTVTRTGECTWQIAFEEPRVVQRYQSLDRQILIDTPVLPFAYTLTTRAPLGSTISPCPPVP